MLEFRALQGQSLGGPAAGRAPGQRLRISRAVPSHFPLIARHFVGYEQAPRARKELAGAGRQQLVLALALERKLRVIEGAADRRYEGDVLGAKTDVREQ